MSFFDSLFGGAPPPQFVMPQNVNAFTSNQGTFTGGLNPSFQFNQDPAKQGQLDQSNALISQLLESLGTPDDQNRARFEQALTDKQNLTLQPELDRRSSQLSSQIGASGAAGSSGNILRQSQDQGNRNRANTEVGLNATLGADQLINNDLQRLLSKFGAATGFNQQDFENQLSAMLGSGNLFGQQQGLQNQNTQLTNQSLANQFSADQAQNQAFWDNLLGAASTAITGFAAV